MESAIAKTWFGHKHEPESGMVSEQPQRFVEIPCASYISNSGQARLDVEGI